MKPIPFLFELTILILISFLLFGCAKNQDHNDAPYQICKISFERIEPSISECVQEAEFQFLELTKNSALSSIDNAEIFDGNIIVFDRKQKSVKVFDDNGMFKNEIGSLGAGPGEFIYLSNFILDKSQKMVGLIAQQKNTVMWFDYTGDLQKEVKVDGDKIVLDNAKLWNNQLYHFSSYPKLETAEYQFYKTDKFINSISLSAFPTDHTKVSISDLHPFSTSNNSLYLHLPFDYNIYEIISDNIRKAFSFDFGQLNLPSDIRETLTDIEANKPENVMKMNMGIMPYIVIKKAVLFQNYFFIDITYNFQRFGCIYNITDNKYFVFRPKLEGMTLGNFVGSIEETDQIMFEVDPISLQDWNGGDSSIFKNIDEFTDMRKKLDINNINSLIVKLSIKESFDL